MHGKIDQKVSENVKTNVIYALLEQVSIRAGRPYGHRRVYRDLVDQNKACDKNRVARVMQENNIWPKTRRKFKVTTDSKRNETIHENHLSRQFYANNPNERWTSDIPYIQTIEG